ncbi:MAG TPA: N-6 DNA methylase [Candidatus Cloacimonadota bacterium]|nr:N-6 DNA methylase [Candidatus Cloacimonadota bacterium]
MLDSNTKKKIDDARDILVGKVPVPSSQVEQITIALIYKFMYDMDNESIELGGNPKYFTGDYAQYAWNKLFDPKLSGEGRVMLYQDALIKIRNNPQLPTLFSDIFKNAFLPYRDPETLKLFLKCIDEFTYEHSEKLGDAFEYLLAVLGSQGDAGQFRTPRHIIDFIVALIDPKKEDSILDPACGTAGFLISAYKHIIKTNSSNYDKVNDPHTFALRSTPLDELVIQNGKKYTGDLLTPDQRAFIHKNIKGYDIAFEMVRLSLVNMYLHGFNTPQIYEYDTLTFTDRWNEYASVILANPPFMTPKGGIRPHQRFTIQAKRSEVLFVDYMLEHLTTNGKAGIIVPEGIIFQSGNAYKQLRKLLVEENFLVGVISLPAGVFNPYSGVKTSILWIDKALAKKTDKIIFLKINADGFDLGAQRRPIEANDLPAAFANAVAYKNAVLSGSEYQVPDKDVILLEKAKLAERGEYNLRGDKYVSLSNETSIYSIVSLIDKVTLIRGVTYKKEDEVSENGTLVLRANNISLDSKLDLRDIKQISKNVEFKDSQILKSGDIFICLASGSKSHVGKVAYIESDTEYCFGGFMGAVRISCSNLIPKYLFYLIKQDRFNEYLCTSISGANINNLTSSILYNFKIPLPPLFVQEEIVAELDSYQKIIDGAKQVVDNWKPCFDIDTNWPLVKLSDVAEIESGFGFPLDYQGSTDKEIPFIKVSDMNLIGNETYIMNWNNTVSTEELHRLKAKSRPQGTVVFPKIGAAIATNKKRILVKDTVYDNNVMGIVPNCNKLLSRFLHAWLLSFNLTDWASDSNPPSIRKATVEDQLIPLPDIAIQQNIVDQIDDEQKLIDANRHLIALYEGKINKRIDSLCINNKEDN